MRNLNSDYEAHLDQVDNPVPETCEWVTSHETWRKWDTMQESALLWITADAGCGKSVMAKFLVNRLVSLPRSRRTKHICYFFFREGLEDQDNASAALSAMLHQLCSSQRRLVQHVTAKFTSVPKKTFSRCSSLWPMLVALLNDPITQDITWVLDGLDECEPKSLDELLKGLTAYLDPGRNQTARSPTARLKVILLSRPHNKIQQTLRLGGEEEEDEASGYELDKARKTRDIRNKFRLIAEEQTDAIAKDIARFVRFKISEFGESIPASELLPDMLVSLESRLISGADYTFLWISLVITLVEDARVDGISITQLESILNTTRLDDVYEKLLSGKAFPLKARKALMLVLAAVRPLSLKEMCAAIEVQQDHFPQDDEAAAIDVPQDYFPKADEATVRARRLDVDGNLTIRRRETPEIMGKAPQVSNTQSVLPRDLEATSTNHQSLPRKGSLTETQSSGSSATPAGTASSSAVHSLDGLGKLLHKPFANHLRQICGHFLRVRGTKVYLVHQTAREFLLARRQLGDDVVRLSRPHWRHSIRLEEANRRLLRTCADYIRLFQFDDSHKYTSHWPRKTVKKYLETIQKDPPRAFFKYAAFHWIDHYRPVRQGLDFSFDDLLTPSSPCFKIWIIVHRSWVREEERSALEARGVCIGGRESQEGREQRDAWLSSNEFYLLRKTADMDSMYHNWWAAGWKDNEGMDKKQAEKFQAVLDHFNFSHGEEMEPYDKEFLAGDRWWKRHKDNDNHSEEEGEEDSEDGEGNGRKGFGVGQIPDRVQFYRRQRRAEVMEVLGEMSNPLSPMLSNPTSFMSSEFFKS